MLTTRELLDLTAAAFDRYTLHSHTQFCDGRSHMEAFARRAVDEGFGLYGFTPHSPLPIASPCNMTAEAVPIYLAEARRIAARYAGSGCRFLTGMEIDFLGHQWNASGEYFRQLPLDYAIGSVHFIPSQQGEYVDIDGRYPAFEQKMHRHFHGDIRYVVDTFFDQSELMLSLGGFQILGHWDKIGLNASQFRPGVESEAWYRRRLDRMVDLIAASDVIVEINTKAYEPFGRFFPSPELVGRLRRAGVPMVVNSDAHYPERISASRAEGLALLRALT